MRSSEAGFSLAWEQYKSVMCTGFQELQQREEFVDMTIAADGHLVRAHQMIVGLASPFLKELLRSAPSPHPILFLNNVSHKILCCILEYMYTGEAFVPAEHLKAFIAASNALHVRGLEDMLPNLDTTTPTTTEKTYNVIETSNNPNEHPDAMQLPVTTHTPQPCAIAANQPQYIIMNPIKERQAVKRDPEGNFMPIKNKLPEMPCVPAKVQKIESEYCEEDVYKLKEQEIIDEDEQGDEGDEDGMDHNNQADEVNSTLDPGTAPKPKIMFTMSNKGGLQMIMNRYMYRVRNRYKDGRRRWECVDYKKKCEAGIVTSEDKLLRRFSLHNHPFHDKKILEKVKKNAVFASIKSTVGHNF